MPRSTHAAAPPKQARAHVRVVRRRSARRRRALGLAIRSPELFARAADPREVYADNELARNVFTRCSCWLCHDDVEPRERRLARAHDADVADALAERAAERR